MVTTHTYTDKHTKYIKRIWNNTDMNTLFTQAACQHVLCYLADTAVSEVQYTLSAVSTLDNQHQERLD